MKNTKSLLKALFTTTLLTTALTTVGAVAGEPKACPKVPYAPNVTAYYDAADRLTLIQAKKERLTITYTAKLIDVSHVEFKMRREQPDKWGRTDVWGPVRWSLYGGQTGELTEVNTYEDMRINNNGRMGGYQTSYSIPADTDFSKLKTEDGKIVYTGPAEHVSAADRKDIGTRSVEIIEPLNIKNAECISFGGLSYPLQRKHAAAAPLEPEPGKRYYTEGGWIEVRSDEQDNASNGANVR